MYYYLLLDWAERERLVVEMYKKGIPPKVICAELKLSFRDYYKILDKHNLRSAEKELTTEHHAILLFDTGKKPAEVAVELRITLDEACRHYIKWMDSLHMGFFGKDYVHMKGYMKELEEICLGIRHAGLRIKDLVTEFQLDRDLGEMEQRNLYLLRSNHDEQNRQEALQNRAQFLEAKLKQLESDIEASEQRLYVANDFLTYSRPNNGYNYYQNTYPSQQYYGNFRYY